MMEHGLIGNFGGIDLVVNKHLPEKMPVLELSYNVSVSDEFRAEFNSWLLEMFGKKSVAYIVDMSMLGGKKIIVMNPSNIARLDLKD
jgi:hypothetical protein